MTKQLSKSAQRVQNALDKQGKTFQVIELPDSTRTAVDAARAVGCQLGQIVKSLVFKAKRSKRPVLVIASGSNRVDERKIEALIGEPLGKADADFVRSSTGFAIGGVPPVGHDPEMPVFIDNDLLQYDEVWAAAGTPHAVFRLDPQDLQSMTGGVLVDIK